MTATPRPGFVDPRGVRFAASINAAVAFVAILVPVWPIPAALAAVLLAAAAGGARTSLWGHAFRGLVRPHLGAPRYLEPDSPPRFANLLGGLMLAGVAAAFALGGVLVGQVLAGVVSGLALLNAAANVCIGCRLYGWLVRPRRRTLAA